MKNALSLHNKKKSRLAQLASLLFLSVSLVATSSAAVYYVDDDSTAPISNGTSWAMAYRTIQGAINEAQAAGASTSDPAQIWVAEGTYTGSGENIVVMAEYVSLYGGFVGNETELGQRNWPLNLTVIDGEETRRGVLGASNATLDGFQIINCLGTRGGGMANNDCSPTISNCSFVNNKAMDFFGGAGAGMLNNNSSPVISNCTFRENSTNSGGGIHNTENSEVTIFDSIFTANRASEGGGILNDKDCILNVTHSVFESNNGSYGGGGIKNTRGSIDISHCEFRNNTSPNNGGAGIDNQDSKAAVINGCIFDGNTSSFGGGFFNNVPPVFFTTPSPTVVTNCVIINNISSHGGAFDNQWGSTLEMANCVVYNNSSSVGPSVRNYNATLNVTNTIFWAEQTSLVVDGGSAEINATYCCVKDGFEGEGNIDQDPMFFNTQFKNFSLRGGSPCIDTGTIESAPATDILENPRPRGNGVDMGAYETILGRVFFSN